MTSSTMSRPSGARDEVDAGIVGIDGGKRARSKLAHLGRRLARHGRAALVHVGDPGAGFAAHGGNDAEACRDHAPVLEIFAGGRHEVLQVIDVVGGLRRWQRARAIDAQQAFALRAEQRLEDERAAGIGDVIFRRGIAFHGARARCRDAGLLQQERRRRFVDAALDRSRIVPHAHAAHTQRVQEAEAERDLLERAG